MASTVARTGKATKKQARALAGSVLSQDENDRDAALADEIIRRLNRLIRDPKVRKDVGRLLCQRIRVSKATAEHPTIQVGPGNTLRMVGLLNGVCGTIKAGKYQGWGYIAAGWSDDERLIRFMRMDKKRQLRR